MKRYQIYIWSMQQWQQRDRIFSNNIGTPFYEGRNSKISEKSYKVSNTSNNVRKMYAQEMKKRQAFIA